MTDEFIGELTKGSLVVPHGARFSTGHAFKRIHRTWHHKSTTGRCTHVVRTRVVTECGARFDPDRLMSPTGKRVRPCSNCARVMEKRSR